MKRSVQKKLGAMRNEYHVAGTVHSGRILGTHQAHEFVKARSESEAESKFIKLHPVTYEILEVEKQWKIQTEKQCLQIKIKI